MNTEIIEGNKLIAEFMGGNKQIIPKGGLHGYKEGTELWRFCLFSSNPGPVTYLEYHSSWEWLMEVVEKIEGLFNGNAFTITNRNLWCIIEMNTQFSLAYDIEYSEISIKASTKLESTWEAVVQFIQWYNTLPK
jgi:hypothetical protein